MACVSGVAERYVVVRQHTNNLNLDIDLDELFGQRIDLDKTWVDCAVEATKFGHETDVSLADWLVWVGADDTAGDGSYASDA